VQVNLDAETIEFITWYAEENFWNTHTKIMDDQPYRQSDIDEDDDRHNLTEILYRIYMKNRDKFPAEEDAD